MDYDKLEAGPVTDALVAEKVMGWKERLIGGAVKVWGVPADKDKSPEGNRWEAQFLVGVWKPSVSIAAVWLVVERMRSLGYRIYISEFTDGFYIKFVAKGRNYDDTAWQEMQRKDVEASICRAALKAIADDTTMTHSEARPDIKGESV